MPPERTWRTNSILSPSSEKGENIKVDKVIDEVNAKLKETVDSLPKMINDIINSRSGACESAAPSLGPSGATTPAPKGHSLAANSYATTAAKPPQIIMKKMTKQRTFLNRNHELREMFQKGRCRFGVKITREEVLENVTDKEKEKHDDTRLFTFPGLFAVRVLTVKKKLSETLGINFNDIIIHDLVFSNNKFAIAWVASDCDLVDTVFERARGMKR